MPVLHMVLNMPEYAWIIPEYARITAQKMKFSIKDFLSKCDQIRSA